jgi:hypothetical protein
MAATTSCVSEDKPAAIAEATEFARVEVVRQAAASGTPVGEIETHVFPANVAPKLIALGFLKPAGEVLTWLVDHAPAVCITATQSYLPADTEVLEA